MINFRIIEAFLVTQIAFISPLLDPKTCTTFKEGKTHIRRKKQSIHKLSSIQIYGVGVSYVFGYADFENQNEKFIKKILRVFRQPSIKSCNSNIEGLIHLNIKSRVRK